MPDGLDPYVIKVLGVDGALACAVAFHKILHIQLGFWVLVQEFKVTQ